jgi:hypothetical protein
VCVPHHDIGDEGDQPEPLALQKLEFEHHGDKAIPGRQRFGYFARSLMRTLGRLNLHVHLPHFERLEQSTDLLEVVVRQRIDEHAPVHPFAPARREFDSVLQSRTGFFEGTLFVTDATLWNSAAGGLSELKKLWRNVALAKPVK